MLKLHTRLHALTPSLSSSLRLGPTTDSASPILRAALSSLRSLTRRSRSSDLVGHRAFFCSDSDSSGDGSDRVVHVDSKAVESEGEEAESKSSSAIVPTNPRPEDYLTVSVFLFFEKKKVLAFIFLKMVFEFWGNFMQCNDDLDHLFQLLWYQPFMYS